MSSNAETQYFDYVKGPDAKKVEEAQNLLDKALEGWAEEHKKDKADCPYAEKGKEYIVALRKLEATQESDAEALKANRDLLEKIVEDLASIQRASLSADIEASQAEANKGPDEKNWDRNFKYFQEHPMGGFFPMIASGIKLLWSKLWGKKTTTSDLAETQTEDDEPDVYTDPDHSKSKEGCPNYPELRLELPAGATLTSDIQTHRASTGRAHSGIDIAGMPEGTELKCPGEGVVVDKGFGKSNGNYVFIDYQIDGKLYTFCFLHLQDTSPLERGQKVDKDTLLGKVGHTGHVIAGKGGHGDHLHFQVYEGGKVVDPMPFLPEKNKAQVVAKRDAIETKDAFWTA